MTLIKLLKPYTRDLEWWVAWPIDPEVGSRFAYLDPGEILDVSEEEARELVAEGIGRRVSRKRWKVPPGGPL